MFEEQSTRRELLKKAAYVTPVILTLAAVPAFAQSGSAPVSESPPVLESPGPGPNLVSPSVGGVETPGEAKGTFGPGSGGRVVPPS